MGAARASTVSRSRASWWTRLRRLAGELDAVVAELEPERADVDGALDLIALFARVRKAAAAGEAVVARRVDECGAHRSTGHRSTAHLLAELGGTTLGRAADVVDTGKRLRDRPATDAALRAGAVSIEQAHAVMAAAEADPDAEAELLALAGRESLRRLAERAQLQVERLVRDEPSSHRRAGGCLRRWGKAQPRKLKRKSCVA